MLKKIGLFSLIAGFAVLVLWTVLVIPQTSDNQRKGDQSFFIRMSHGDEVTIAVSGPLRLFARCTLEPVFGSTVVEAFITSSEGGWFVSSDPQVSQGAGVEKTLCGDIDAFIPVYINCGSGRHTVSPSGHYLGVVLMGEGINMFGSDCLVAGQVVSTRE